MLYARVMGWILFCPEMKRNRNPQLILVNKKTKTLPLSHGSAYYPITPPSYTSLPRSRSLSSEQTNVDCFADLRQKQTKTNKQEKKKKKKKKKKKNCLQVLKKKTNDFCGEKKT